MKSIYKYGKRTKLKLTPISAEAFNDSDDYDAEHPWCVGDIIEVEPSSFELAKGYNEEEDYYPEENTYCIHDHMTHIGWSKGFIEDINNFIPVNMKIKDWKNEIER